MPEPNGSPGPADPSPVSSRTPSAGRALLRVGLPLIALLVVGWWVTQQRTGPTGNLVVTPAVVAEPDTAPLESLTSELVLADKKEPGTPLVIQGYVYGDGGRPVAGTRVLVYHADAKGEYGQSTRNMTWARLSGEMKTDSLGRYRIRTVKPGSYGGPAHVHFVVGGWGGQNYELRFATDRSNSTLPGFAADTGFFGSVRAEVVDAQGVHHVRRDFRLP